MGVEDAHPKGCLVSQKQYFCGCPIKSKYPELSGKLVGSIVVLYQVNSDKHSCRQYKIKCLLDNNEKICRASTIISGDIISCGCKSIKNLLSVNKSELRKKYREASAKTVRKKLEKYLNVVINRLMLIEILDYCNNHKNILGRYMCLCKDKTIKILPIKKVVNEVVKSCGCLRKESCSKLGVKTTSKGHFTKTIIWIYESKNKKIFMRSGYELMVAEILDRKNIEWLYEPYVIRFDEQTAYIPDFYIPSQNRWLEPKGDYTEEDKLKLQLFRGLGNSVILLKQKTIEILYGESYYLFKKRYKLKYPDRIIKINNDNLE